MTVELDLSSALTLRVANVDALALRIANIDVWPWPGGGGVPQVSIPATSNDMSISDGVDSIVLNKPVNTADGDVLIAILEDRFATSIAIASGWTAIGSANPLNSLGFGGMTACWMYVTDASSLPSSWTFTGTSAGRSFGIIFRAINAASSGPATESYSSANPSPYTHPSQDMPDGSLALLVMGTYVISPGYDFTTVSVSSPFALFYSIASTAGAGRKALAAWTASGEAATGTVSVDPSNQTCGGVLMVIPSKGV